MTVILPCCGGNFIGDKSYHEEWCPTYIRAALSWIDENSGEKVRKRAEFALDSLMDRDGKVRAVTLTDVLPLSVRLYQEGSIGCCLHMPLGAGEMGREFIQESIELARNKNHAHCETLARVLLRLTDAQRTRLSKMVQTER